MGGILTLGSVAMTWINLGGNLPLSVFQANAEVWFVPWMIIAGGLASMVSRYGGLITIIAIVSYTLTPPHYTGSISMGATTFEIGFWLACVGAGSSIIGSPWSLPFPRTTLPFHKKVKNGTIEKPFSSPWIE
jgi:hypothetical protein